MSESQEGAAIKSLALFIRKYGKEELMKTLDELHREYEFEKVQEILGYDMKKGLKILEEKRGK